MKVAIDVPVLPGVTGGVAVAVQSLLQGLGQLNDGDEEYVVIAHGDEQEAWVASFLGPNQRIVRFPTGTRRRRGLVRRLLGPLVNYVRQRLDQRVWSDVPVSGGFYESLGCDVLHIPTQNFVLCAMPTIYNPHDLQHLRFPQYFTPALFRWRETVYPAGCRFADTVVVGSRWIKEDVVKRYNVHPDKIQVIPEAAPTALADEPAPDELAAVRARYALEQPFVLFPGVTWPHKNHLRLFAALAQLRDRAGVTVNLVCTGAQDSNHWPRIEEGLRTFALQGQVRFLGYLPERDLRALYRLATALVLPTLYEASSLPVFEAWLHGLPVASSRATAMPEQIANAGLLFDPLDVTAMADAICRMVTDAELRATLRRRGAARLADFDAGAMSRAYRAVYRRATGAALTEEDHALLRRDAMPPARAGAG